MQLIPQNNRAEIGLCGHCGCGHAHSHNGFTQDDSAGFAVVANILKQSMPIDTGIREISSSSDGHIKIVLNCGGMGDAFSDAGVDELFALEFGVGHADGVAADAEPVG